MSPVFSISLGPFSLPVLLQMQVGSFEEVMRRMTGSSGDDLASWAQVMFVAPGLLQQAAPANGVQGKDAKQLTAAKK